MPEVKPIPDQARPVPRLPALHPVACGAAAALIGSAIIALDIWMALGVAAGVSYVGLVLLGLLFGDRRTVVPLATAATVLMVAGGYFSPHDAATWQVLIDRALALPILWITAYGVYRWCGGTGGARGSVDDTSGNGPTKHAYPHPQTALNIAASETVDESALIKAALDSMAQGFTAFDKDNRLIAFNDKVSGYFDYPPGFLRLGMSNEEIFRFRVAQGFYGDGDPDEIVEKLLERSNNPLERTVEQILKNGRTHIFHRRPMPGGGYVNTYTDITKQKRAEKEAAAKSAYLEGIFKAGGTGYCIVDPEFKLIDYNETFEHLFGFPKGFLRPGLSRKEITRCRHDLGHFGDETFEETIARRERSRNREAYAEKTLPNGTSYFYHRKFLPGGGYVTSYIETTTLRRAERRAEEKSKLLDTALHTMGQGVVIYGSDQRVAAYNEKFLEMAGLPAGCRPLGKSHEEILRLRAREGRTAEPLTEEVIKKRLKNHAIGPEVVNERMRDDGSAFIYHRVPLPGGGSVSTFTDITSQKQTEVALRANQAQLALAQEMAHIGSWELDLVNDKLTWSEEIYRMFEVSADEFGASYEAFLSFVHPDDREAVDTAYADSIANHEPYRIEHRLLMRDGRIKFVAERCQTWFDDEGRPIRSVGTVQDITEQKRAEEELHQAQKMEVIGQLTGGVAHDFNNLLAVILGNAELLADEVGQDNRKIGAVQHAAARGAELTQRLLSFSRRQSLFPRPVDPSALIGDLLDLVRRTLGETIKVTTKCDFRVWSAQADPGQLENALLNLAINARDAMPGGGKLTITCANAVLDEDFLPMTAEARGRDYVMVAVSDTGTGMPQDVLDRAFEPFYTTKGVGKGSGLGLSMVYGFAMQSGGHVSIDSKEGWGTTVRLYLPRCEDAERAEAEPRARGPAPTQNARILVIEDDADVQDLVSGMLESLGYPVITAGTCAAALDILGRQDVDLVLSDVVLPDGINGQAFVDRARATRPGIRVIFMSGYPASATDRGAPAGSETVLLAKPFRRQVLADAVSAALKGDPTACATLASSA